MPLFKVTQDNAVSMQWVEMPGGGGGGALLSGYNRGRAARQDLILIGFLLKRGIYFITFCLKPAAGYTYN